MQHVLIQALFFGKAAVIELLTTYLEMFAPPEATGQERASLDVRRMDPPAVGFFRYLYNSIGDGTNGYWWVRRQMSDAALEAILSRPGSAFFILYEGGSPAGFYELDLGDPLNIEIAFFGILPEFQGRKLGRGLLTHAIQNAWSLKPERLWIHTCNFDSLRALASYVKAGFEVYAEETQWIALPHFDVAANYVP
jgi:GNAT superfamily N-acetyltransferase